MPALVVRKSVDLNDAAVTATCAELVDVPKTPKTNPAIATDATRVTATMSTVATIGEMALLPRLRNRSEERRVGKECGNRRWREDEEWNSNQSFRRETQVKPS